MNWYLDVLKKYSVAEGRASRSEYWMFTLYSMTIALVLLALDFVLLDGLPVLQLIYLACVLVPTICVGVRRLHDTNRSGWWMLISFVPCVGGLVLLFFMTSDSTPGDNQFGSNPKSAE